TSTKERLSNKGLTRDTPRIRIAPALEGQLKQLRNDGQPIDSEHYQKVNEAQGWLSQYGNARLTGNEDCIFASFTTEEECRYVFSLLPANFKGFVARGVNRSPAHELLQRQTQTELQ